MEFRAITQSDIDFMSEHTKNNECYKETAGLSEYTYALVADKDQTLAVGGFRMMNKTTCVAWVDISDIGFEHIHVVIRAIKEWSDGYTDTNGEYHTGFYEVMGILRAEAYVLVGFEKGENLVRHLGFNLERRVLKYYGQSPADVYVQYFDWGTK